MSKNNGNLAAPRVIERVFECLLGFNPATYAAGLFQTAIIEDQIHARRAQPAQGFQATP